MQQTGRLTESGKMSNFNRNEPPRASGKAARKEGTNSVECLSFVLMLWFCFDSRKIFFFTPQVRFEFVGTRGYWCKKGQNVAPWALPLVCHPVPHDDDQTRGIPKLHDTWRKWSCPSIENWRVPSYCTWQEEPFWVGPNPCFRALVPNIVPPQQLPCCTHYKHFEVGLYYWNIAMPSDV